jgi:hypothetical protein
VSIPDTRLTRNLRVLWECTEMGETWEQWYARHCEGASTNGRAIAALLFDRALTYWPDFFTPSDTPAVVVWGEMVDAYIPTVTPDVIEQAVDAVAASGVRPHGPAYFLRAAEKILEAPSGS